MLKINAKICKKKNFIFHNCTLFYTFISKQFFDGYSKGMRSQSYMQGYTALDGS